MATATIGADSPLKQIYHVLNPQGASQSKRRTNFKYSENSTASYIPSPLLKNLNTALLKLPVEKLVEFPSVSLNLLKQLKDDIANHAEMRLQLFWLQLLLVYKSGLSHKCRSTDLQVGKGNLDFAAAHSSTLPSITSFDQEDNFPLLKNSFFDRIENGTTLLPNAINFVDSEIDLHNREMQVDKALRETAIEILNTVSKIADGKSPKEGFKEFIEEFSSLVSKSCQAHQSRLPTISKIRGQERCKQEIFVLKCYQKVARSYLEKIETEPLMQRLCFVPTDIGLDDSFYLKIQAEMWWSALGNPQMVPQILEIVTAKLRPMKGPSQPAIEDITSSQALSQPAVQKKAASSQASSPEKTSVPLVKPKLSSSKGNFLEANRKILHALTPSSLTPTSTKYLSLCLTSDAVKKMVIHYLTYTNQATVIKDIKNLPSIKKSKTVSRYDLSEGIQKVHAKALNCIKEQFGVKEPEKMGLILLNLMSLSAM